MKTAIIFATKQGCTEKCAIELGQKISNAKLFNLDQISDIDISTYDSIIIGGSIQAGSINKLVTNYINNNTSELKNKRLGLFICCMDEKLAQEQFESAYPNELREQSIANGLFGGEFDFNKMNAFEKAIIKKMAGIEESISKIDFKAIEEFAENFK